MGGDYPSCYKSPLKSVSIHAPVWGATQTISQRAWTWRRFNPRPRMGGDPWRDGLITVRRRFNPRPRMGGDVSQGYFFVHLYVSIHAPVWGATHLTIFVSYPVGVSIHAPVWGATLEGRVDWQLRGVSIHAPVWGATLISLIMLSKN